MNLMPSNRSPRLMPRLRACSTVHSPVGFAVTPPRCIRRVPCSMKTRMYSLFSSTVSTCRKSTARISAAWACRNCRQVGPARRGAGSMSAACRIFHTVTALRRCRVSSARRGCSGVPTADSPSPGERRGVRCPGVLAAGLAPVARLVLSRGQPAVPGQQRRGRNGKTSVRRLRGMSRASAANHTRSAGSYRTRPAWRRSTAFSCRSTSSSASFARSLRNTRTARPSSRQISR